MVNVHMQIYSHAQNTQDLMEETFLLSWVHMKTDTLTWFSLELPLHMNYLNLSLWSQLISKGPLRTKCNRGAQVLSIDPFNIISSNLLRPVTD